nr:GNAT family N-acetyltransferase [Nocardioides sp. JQ2195]
MRSQIVLRDATVDDSAALADLWSELMRRPVSGTHTDEMAQIIESAAASDEDRIVVAEIDGEVAGGVFLRVSVLSPINLDPVVQAISPHVDPRFRRRGIGRALMECAVQYAEEHGVAHVAGASLSNSRDAHRFLARMALAPQAVLRVAPTHVVRAKLTGRRPASRARQPLGQVLAQRRSMRHQRESV